MRLTSGSPAVVVGLVDGPIDLSHPHLSHARVRVIGATSSSAHPFGEEHGTFVAGVLASADPLAPGVCPQCTILARPVFGGADVSGTGLPLCPAGDAARAISTLIAAGARIVNLSIGLNAASLDGSGELDASVEDAMRRDAIVVAAAGNQGRVGATSLTRHRWLIPVVASDDRGWPLAASNLGRSIARHGVTAPAERVPGLSPGGGSTSMGGTSIAAAYVTGTVALLWSLFPDAHAAQIVEALGPGRQRRSSLVPPLLDPWGAYTALEQARKKGAAA